MRIVRYKTLLVDITLVQPELTICRFMLKCCSRWSYTISYGFAIVIFIELVTFLTYTGTQSTVRMGRNVAFFVFITLVMKSIFTMMQFVVCRTGKLRLWHARSTHSFCIFLVALHTNTYSKVTAYCRGDVALFIFMTIIHFVRVTYRRF